MIKKLNIIIAISTLICLNGVSFIAFSQEDNLVKEVQVVRPYEPTISDAFKLNILPQVEDTIRIQPTFSYNLAIRPVTINFAVNPIPPARMVAEPLSRASQGYIKAGFGNYASPLLEVYYSNERSKDYSYGANFKHYSSFGNIKLDNKQKVDGDFSHTSFNAFGKKIFNNSALAGDMGILRYGYGFYGHDTSAVAMPVPEEVDRQMQQRFNVNVSYYSTHSDSAHFNYQALAHFSNFTDKFDMQQNTFALRADLDRFFKIEKVGGRIEFTHHMNNLSLAPGDNSILSFAPWIGLFGKQWRVKAGVNAAFDINQQGTQSHFYPIGQLSYDIVSNYVIPYFQFSGYLEDNNYAKIMGENPWVSPGLNLWNTSHKFILRGGVKGNLSPRVAYNVSASYSLIDSAYFFVNQPDGSNSFLENRFSVEYDNVRYKNFLGELTIAPTTKIKVFLQAQFNSYTMQDIERPWHKPSYVGRAMASYNIQDKILLKANFFIEGKRYIRTFNGSSREIDGIMDLNLGVEYRYNRRVSAFLDLNNLTGNRYHLWHLYPVQQFNMRLGLTYAL